jgi:drug/metabolite transporter (DMT)-like permease
MFYLVIVSVMWSFSFGLIKNNLAELDSNFVAFARMLVAFLAFAPFLRLKGVKPSLIVKLVLLGGVQFGVMYVAYIHSYRYLLAHQVALYTIFTPIYVTLINDLLDRRIRPRFLFTALIAVAGAWVVLRGEFGRFEIRTGFLILQGANVCFAAGQILYKRVMARQAGALEAGVFGWLYLGALAVTAAAAATTADTQDLDLSAIQILTLTYLGALASGLGFFLWNFGARRTHAGNLAVLNNLKVPLAVVVSLVVFSERGSGTKGGNVTALIIGGGLIVAALFVNDRFIRRGSGRA